MISTQFDLVIVGGGIAGSVLAKVMAERGARVLIVEKEKEFKDRLRGEAMAPWGFPEAQQLGITQLLRDTCFHELPWVKTFLRKTQLEYRNLVQTTRCHNAEFAFSHPVMQEVLLQAAADAGALVYRGATARELRWGYCPTLVFDHDHCVQTVQGRLIVGADGRRSSVRRMSQFEVQKDPEERLMAAVLLEGMSIPADTSHAVFDPKRGQLVALFPQGKDRVRAYFSYPSSARGRLQGDADLPLLIQESINAGASAEWFVGVRSAGPLATFASDDQWVDHPSKEGVVLVGDAAAHSDPMFGQGIALTLRDIRVLSKHLIATDDWNEACRAYAREHDRHYQTIHTFSHWYEALFYHTGLQASLLRARVLPLLAQDRSRMPDVFFSGPDAPLTEADRRRMFGEE